MFTKLRSARKLFVVTVIFLAAMSVCNELRPADSCVSIAPAKFSKTKGWVGEALRKGEYVHILAYENTVQNFATFRGNPTGNAMFLPIPAVPGSMSEENLIDTSKCQHILTDMEANVLDYINRVNKLTVWAGNGPAELKSDVEVFSSGIYTIVLAQHARDIPSAISKVPEKKRPALNEKIFDAYERWYPNWTFALCCFDTTEAKQADPMLWWYKPMNKEELFFPALDCHTGEVPSLSANVDVDHMLIASSPSFDAACDKVGYFNPVRWYKGQQEGMPYVPHSAVNYSDWFVPSSVRDLLPKYVFGSQFRGSKKQGDFVISTKDLVAHSDPQSYSRGGISSWRRVLPPGADPMLKDRSYGANSDLKIASGSRVVLTCSKEGKSQKLQTSR